MKIKLNKKILIFVVAAFIVVFFGFKFMLLNSEAYRVSKMHIIQNAVIQKHIGSNIKTGFWISGSISHMGERSFARFVIPLKGEKGKAHAEVEANKKNGEWNVIKMDLFHENKGQRKILPANKAN